MRRLCWMPLMPFLFLPDTMVTTGKEFSMAETTNSEALTLQLSPQEISALREIARRSNTTASVLVRDWVRERLEKERED
jgi:hypothetical protein